MPFCENPLCMAYDYPESEPVIHTVRGDGPFTLKRRYFIAAHDDGEEKNADTVVLCTVCGAAADVLLTRFVDAKST